MELIRVYQGFKEGIKVWFAKKMREEEEERKKKKGRSQILIV